MAHAMVRIQPDHLASFPPIGHQPCGRGRGRIKATGRGLGCRGLCQEERRQRDHLVSRESPNDSAAGAKRATSLTAGGGGNLPLRQHPARVPAGGGAARGAGEAAEGEGRRVAQAPPPPLRRAGSAVGCQPHGFSASLPPNSGGCLIYTPAEAFLFANY